MEDLKQIQEFFSKPLNEGKQLDIEDFAKVVQAVTKTGHPVTVLLTPKFNEIEIITGMNAPDDILFDLSNAVDSLGYGRNDIIIAGDSSNLSRREYSDIRRVNGGHKDYFEESLNENEDPIEVKYFKRGDTYFQILVKYERPVGFLRALGRQTAFGQQIDQNEAAAQERVKTIVNDLKEDFDLDEIFVEKGQVAGRYYINAFSDDFIDMDANDLEGFYTLEEATKEEENKFHTKLDKLVHKTFGPSSDEKKEMEEYNTGLYYDPSRDKSANKAKEASKSGLEKVRDFVKKVMKEEEITVDDATEFKINLKHLLDKHAVTEEEGYSQFLKTDDNPEGKTKGLDTKTMNKILMNVIKDLDELKQLGEGVIEEELCAKGKAYRKKRMAAGEKSSAYLNGRAVKVCKGQMKG